MRKLLSFLLLAYCCIYAGAAHADTYEFVDSITYYFIDYTTTTDFTAAVRMEVTYISTLKSSNKTEKRASTKYYTKHDFRVKRDGDLVIPATVVTADGRTRRVTSIYDKNYSNNYSDSYVTYNYYYFTSVDVQAAAAIGEEAFSEITTLKRVTLAEGCTASGTSVFEGCTALAYVDLPSSMNITNKMFYGCTALKAVTCRATTPQDISSITNPFPTGISETCTLYVPEESVEAYKASSGWTKYFANIEAIDESTPAAAGDIIYNDNMAYEVTSFGDTNEVRVANQTANGGVTYGDVVIPETFTYSYTYEDVKYTVTGLAGGSEETGAFADTNITSVVVPATVTSMTDGYEFYGCSSLTSATLPALSEIGPATFGGRTTSLTFLRLLGATPPVISETQPVPNNIMTRCSLYVPVEAIDTYNADSYWKGFKSVGYAYVGEIIYDENGVAYEITSLGDTNELTVAVQSDNGGITSGDVVIPEGFTYGEVEFTVTGIARQAFSGSDITSVEIPGTIESWDSYGFAGCHRLKKVVVAEGMETIGGTYCFSNCTTLKTVVLSSTTTAFATGILSSCSNLQEMVLSAETPPEKCPLTSSMQATCVLYVPATSVDAYKAASNWSGFAKIYPLSRWQNYDYTDDWDDIVLGYNYVFWDYDDEHVYYKFLPLADGIFSEYADSYMIMDVCTDKDLTEAIDYFYENKSNSQDSIKFELNGGTTYYLHMWLNAPKYKAFGFNPVSFNVTYEFTEDPLYWITPDSGTYAEVPSITINSRDGMYLTDSNADLSTITIVHEGEIYATVSSIEPVDPTSLYDFGEMLVLDKPLTDEGTYAVVIPAGFFSYRDDGSESDETSERIALTYVIGDEATGINSVASAAETDAPAGVYNLAGQRIAKPVPGTVSIVKYADGTVKKVMQK